MPLEKVTSVDLIETLENGCVQVRTKTTILENGKQISVSLHRHVVVPGDDYFGEDARVKAICAATHTSDIIEAYKTTKSVEEN